MTKALQHQIAWIRQQQKTAVKQIQDVLNLHRGNIVIVDTETTGLDYITDEVIQVGVVDYGTTETLMNRFLLPEVKIHPKAFEKHHLTRDILKERSATKFKFIHQELFDLLHGKVVFGYNLNFDSYFLTRMCVDDKLPMFAPERWQDMMGLFSQIAGKWDSNRGRFQWQKLTYFSKNRVGRDAHDAVGDCHLVIKQLRQIDRFYKTGGVK